MPTTVPPREGDALATPSLPPLLSDEAALRRVVESELPTLTAAAHEKLGDAGALTPRVLEGAFVHAWQQRERFQSEAQLHEFLVDEVRHEAARALSRRAAAHRMGGAHDEAHGTAHASAGPDADAAQIWARVERAIHNEGHSVNSLKQVAAISRHDAAAHVAEIGRGRSWKIPAIVGVVTVGIAVGAVWLADKLGEDRRIATTVNSADVREVKSAWGQFGELTLDDGTKVRLAPDTKLLIPNKFGPEMRAVRLEGSATFEAPAGQPKPLQVHTRSAVFVTKGTSFVVTSYPNLPGVTLKVTEGTVEARVGEARQDVAAGSALLVGKDGVARAPSAEELEEAAGWTEGRLTVVNRRLGDVLPALQRWYNLDVKVPELPVLERPVSFRVSLDSTKQAVSEIEKQAAVRYRLVNTVKVFMDEKPKGKK